MATRAENNAAVDAWLAETGPRVTLQADLTWAGGMDGYLQAGTQDKANPFMQVWWVLEPRAEHCSNCPALAAGSPYDAPWVIGGNTLNNTPGDGQTECGAGCKCSLQYEPPEGLADMPTPLPDTSWLPEDMPGAESTTQPPEGTPAPAENPNPYGPPIGPDGFSKEQKAALDLYRLAALEWNRVRGSIQPLPNFFMLARPDLEWEQFSWHDLTPEQQQALRLALEAFVRWQDATLMPESGADVQAGDGQRGMVLSNPYPRQKGGLFGFGGPGHLTGGGGTHGGAQHAGVGHVSAMVGAHAAVGGGGGGGGGSAGTIATKSAKAAPKTTTKAAKGAKPKAAKVAKAAKPEPTEEEALNARITKAKNALARAKTAENKAARDVELRKTDPALQAKLDQLATARHEAYINEFNSRGEVKDAIAQERIAAKIAKGKAPVTTAKYIEAKKTYDTAKPEYERLKKEYSDAQTKTHDILNAHLDDYRAMSAKYGYNAYNRFHKAFPEYKQAQDAETTARRALDKVQNKWYRIQGKYETLHDQLAGKISDKEIDAHPMRAQRIAEHKAASDAYHEATGEKAHQAAVLKRQDAQHEYMSALAARDHPASKYGVRIVETSHAKYTEPEQWPADRIEAAKRAENQMSARINAGEERQHVGDLALKSLMHEQGFDGHATIVDEATLKDGIKAGDIEIWRGDTKLDYTDTYMMGEEHVGLGVRGHGTYAQRHESNGIDTAKRYALAHNNQRGYAGKIMHMAIKSDAKVVDYTQLLREQQDFAQKAADLLARAQANRDVVGIRYARQLQYLGSGNSSHFAVARGYDAIDIPEHGQVIVLNRTAVRISNEIVDPKAV